MQHSCSASKHHHKTRLNKQHDLRDTKYDCQVKLILQLLHCVVFVFLDILLEGRGGKDILDQIKGNQQFKISVYKQDKASPFGSRFSHCIFNTDKFWSHHVQILLVLSIQKLADGSSDQTSHFQLRTVMLFAT